MTKKPTQNNLLGFSLMMLSFILFSGLTKIQAQFAGFTLPSTAYVGDAVQMINSNQTGFTNSWDINDDGSVEYTTTDITHTFTSVGVKCIRLTSFNSSGRDSILKCINIVKPTNKVNNAMNDLAVNVYPNPSSGMVYLNFNHTVPENMEVKIFNATGVMIFDNRNINCRSSIQKINLSHEANGLYNFLITVSGKQITKTILLHH